MKVVFSVFSFMTYNKALYIFSCLLTKERWWEKLWKIPECIRGWDDQLKLRVPSQLSLQGGVTDAEWLLSWA